MLIAVLLLPLVAWNALGSPCVSLPAEACGESSTCAWCQDYCWDAACPDDRVSIVVLESEIENTHIVLAAKEIRRYYYAVYGDLPEIIQLAEVDILDSLATVVRGGQAIVVTANQTAATQLLSEHVYVTDDNHLLRTVSLLGSRVHVLVGGSGLGALYAAYQFARTLGVRFYLKGDMVPSTPLHATIPHLDQTAEPTFALRGLQPFHDFFEGPDWWSADMHKAVLTQSTKLRFNFIGFHTYPYSAEQQTGTNEPTVWVGLTESVLENGTVTFSYPTAYANTLRDQWGETAMNTSDFPFGASQIYQDDCFGNSVLADYCPFPDGMDANNNVFNAVGNLFNDAFTFAHQMGVKTCVGTETPLSMPPTPNPVVEPLNLYRSPSRHDSFVTTTMCDECNGLYQYVDIEGFVWSAPFDGAVALSTYYDGHDNYLSTVPIPGYGFVRVEGYAWPNTTQNASLVPLSLYYNEQIGDHFSTSTAEGHAYANANGYVLLQAAQVFVIPNATTLTQQFYEGTFTRIERTYPIDYYWIWTPEAWEWGAMTSNTSDFDNAVNDLGYALQAHDAINASFEMATCGWVLGPLPNRTIFDQETIATSFTYFQVLSKQYAAISSIDMDVGNLPVDPQYAQVVRHSKWAIPWMEDDPGLTAPELWLNRTLEHMLEAASYNCSGLLGIHWRTGVTSPQITAMADHSWNASLLSIDFWNDWALTSFGNSSNSLSIAAIFSAIESFNFPRPVGWVNGPGTFSPGQCENFDQYDFVASLVSLRDGVIGIAELAEYDYWLNNFLYMQAIAFTECAWLEYNNAIAAVLAAPESQQQALAYALALPARISLIANTTTMMSYLLQTITTPGEMGTVSNVILQSLVLAINDNDAQLESLLGEPLPQAAQPPSYYSGPSRIAVPTVRTLLAEGEILNLDVLLFVNGSNSGDQATVTLQYRPLGTSIPFAVYIMTLAAEGRSVFLASLPAQAGDFEYFIEAQLPSGDVLEWPAGAPDNVQTVVVSPL